MPDALCLEYRPVGGCRIEGMRTGEDCAVQTRRLERIVSAHGDQRAADECKTCEPVKQSEFAHCVGDVNGGVRLYAAAFGSLAEFACGAKLRNLGTARCMTRNDDGQELRVTCAQRVMRGKNCLVLAGMSLRGKQYRPPKGRGLEFSEHRCVERQRRRVLLQAADHTHVLRAEVSETGSDLFVLRETNVEGAEDRSCGFPRPTPALERTLRHPRIDQCEARSRHLRAEDQIGPEIGVDEEANGGMPMLQEASCGSRGIDGDKLMERALGQALAHEHCRRYRAARYQHFEVVGNKGLDQGQRREAFAVAGAMDPDEPAIRTCHSRNAETLGCPLAIFLAK